MTTLTEPTTEKQPDSSAAPRVYFIQIDQGKGKHLQVAILLASLGIGFASAVALAFCIGEGPVTGLENLVDAGGWRTALGIAATLLITLVLFAIIVGPVVAVQLWLGFRVLPELKARMTRLDSISRQPMALSRLPHRILEHGIRPQPLQRSKDQKGFKLHHLESSASTLVTMFPGPATYVIFNQRRRFSRSVPRINRAFEPVRFSNTRELLQETVQCTRPLRFDERLKQCLSSDRPFVSLFGDVLMCAFFCSLFVAALRTSPQPVRAAITIAAIVVICTLYAIRRRLLRRSWWLVPGGLLLRENHPLRGTTKVGLVDRMTASLFIEVGERAFVYQAGKKYVIRCPGRQTDALLAAWLSPARTPTKDEVLAFFGPDAEWMESIERPPNGGHSE